MNTNQDLYDVLGVSQSASLEDIRSTYRALARRLHPDVNPHPGAATQFRDVASAYEILGDVGARDLYNRRRTNADEKPYFTLRLTPSKRVLPLLNTQLRRL